MQSHVLFQQYVLMFVTYSVLGYVAEVLYCSLLEHKLVNRGFLYGPWIPIYGFGGVVIHLATINLQLASATCIHVFFTSMLSASCIEYFGSWCMEKCFDLKLWDYSARRFNLNGRVCLLNSTLFGFGGIILTYGVNEKLTIVVEGLSQDTLAWSSNFLLLLFTVDLVCSVNRLNRFREGISELERLVEQGKENMAMLGGMEKKELFAFAQKRLIARSEAWKQKFALRNVRLFAKFPTMKSRGALHLESLWERLKCDDPLRDFKMKVLSHD